MLKISIGTIPHKSHRYESVGDWMEDKKGRRTIEVSEMKNEDYEFLVALHEMVEQHLCKKAGVLDCDVTAFDVQFEQNRKKGDVSEPGDHEDAPYKREHFIATNVERIVADAIGVDWKTYDDAVVNL